MLGLQDLVHVTHGRIIIMKPGDLYKICLIESHAYPIEGWDIQKFPLGSAVLIINIITKPKEGECFVVMLINDRLCGVYESWIGRNTEKVI